jgi:hypothetical protein
MTLEEKKELENVLAYWIAKKNGFEHDYDKERLEGHKIDIKADIDKCNAKIEQIKEQLDPKPKQPQNVWHTFFQQRQVKIIDGGVSITVNCNREEHYSPFLLKPFQKALDKPYTQLYFIVACPYQRPLSLAKRLVYEMREARDMTWLGDAATPDDIPAIKLKFHPLTKEITWSKLWSQVQSSLINAKQADSPQKYAENCPKEYVVLLFSITNMQQDTLEHLEHIIDQFAEASNNKCKFLLFISLEFLHIEKETGFDACKPAWEQFRVLYDHLCQKWPETLKTHCLKILPAVKATSIERWSSEFLEPNNRLKNRLYQDIIQQLNAELPEPQNTFDMEQVETMQEAAWKYAQQSENYSF